MSVISIRQSLIVSVVLVISLQLNGQSYESFTDPRDGKTYQTLSISGKTWMAQNLNFESPDSWCYMDKAELCKEHGRLYTWAAAKRACPSGWRLPTDADWKSLENANGGPDNAGAKLMHGGSTGFNATLSGIRCTDGEFVNMGIYGDYWTSSLDPVGNVYVRYFFVQHKKLYRISFHKDTGRCVRCIKD